MSERARHVVVTTTRTDTATRALASALGEILEGRDEGHGPIAVPIGTETHARAGLEDFDGADVLVALDAVALEGARGANVGLRVAYWPGLGDTWLGSLESADAVLVPHASSVELALARGAARADIEVVGPLAPGGLKRATDRAATLAELLPGAALSDETRIVVVPFAALPGADLSATLTQLSLAKGPLLVVFDVDDDVDAAKSVRAVAPRFGLTAALVSDRELAHAMYGVADRVLVRLEGAESFTALAAGAGLVVLRPKTRETTAARALADEGLLAIAGNVAMLAVTLDEALTVGSLERSRAAIAALDIPATGARIAQAIEAAHLRHRPRATGLPRGIELLATDPLDAAAPMLAPLVRAAQDKRQAEEAAIDRELAELKKRIGG